LIGLAPKNGLGGPGAFRREDIIQYQYMWIINSIKLTDSGLGLGETVLAVAPVGLGDAAT